MSTELVHHSIHIPQWKKDEIEDIKRLIASHLSVGIVGVHGIPSIQLQLMRKSLRGIAHLKMCRNSLIDRALTESSDDVKKIARYIEDQTALIFTDENPFKLYKILDQGKTSAPIKAGTVSPKDIVIEKGPTSFPPGPIVGELTGAGIPAGIEGGKVVIRQTKTVARKGDIVDAKLASILSRLEIHPMELGLDVRAVYEHGMIFESKILSVDEATHINNLISAVQMAFNLSVNAAYPTKATISTLLTTAASRSRNLAINADLIIPEIIDVLLGKANAHMMTIARLALEKDAHSVSDRLKEKLAAAPKDEKKPEAVKAEIEKKEIKQEDIAAGLSSLFG